jgi:hypothetical protein
MRIYTFLSSALLLACMAFTQSTETIVTIKDERSNPDYHTDTTTHDKKNGDLFIDRIFVNDAEAKAVNNVYEVYFFKPFEGKLKYYEIGLIESTSFDRASYSWQNDTVVKMMLFSTKSNQFKIVSLVQDGKFADLAPE